MLLPFNRLTSPEGICPNAETVNERVLASYFLFIFRLINAGVDIHWSISFETFSRRGKKAGPGVLPPFPLSAPYFVKFVRSNIMPGA